MDDGTSRRRFLGYLIAAPTLVAAADLALTAAPEPAGAAVLSLPEPADLFDLGDLLVLASMPTSNKIAIQINTDSTASFALPRAEVGQGITTATAMIIAEELDLAVDRMFHHVRRRSARTASSTSSPAAPTPSARSTPPFGTPRRPPASVWSIRLRRTGRCRPGSARRPTAWCAARAARARPTDRLPCRPRQASRPTMPGNDEEDVVLRRHRDGAAIGSTRWTSSPVARRSSWTCTYRTRFRPWCADRRRSTARCRRYANLSQCVRCRDHGRRDRVDRCRRAGCDVRSVHRRGRRVEGHAGVQGPRTPSPTPTSSPNCARPRSRCSARNWPAGPRPSTATSSSTSAATARSRPMRRSPTFAQIAPRSGRR